MATTRLSSSERRAAIVNRAVELFAAKGFRGVTTRQLAAAVGVSEPVLYQHFATKQDLYRAILDERLAKGDRKIPNELDFAACGNDRTFLINLAEGIIHWHTSDPVSLRLLMFAALEGHELSSMFQERHMLVFAEALADYFRRRMEDGAFRPMDPRTVAQIFVGTAAHFGASQVLFHKTYAGSREPVEDFVTIFLEGLKQRP